MASRDHIHTYVQWKERGVKNRLANFYRCAAPNCTHFITREIVLGKNSLCNECGDEFVLTRDDLLRVRPRCKKCSDTKKGRVARMAHGVLDSIFREGDK